MTALDMTAGELQTVRSAVRELLAGASDQGAVRQARLWQGVYAHRRPGLVMVRVKLPQGRVTPAQLHTIARLAETEAGGVVHLTTRQDVQLHDVPLRRAPHVLGVLAEAGLTTREACGNSVRNVTACALAGWCPLERIRAAEVGAAITSHLLRHPLSQNLPRKFKVAVSGCPADCAMAAIHDVGLVADSRSTWLVLLGGGLGPRPMAAGELGRYPTRQLLRVIEAVLRVFVAHGDRGDARRARLKFVVARHGIDRVRQWVTEELPLTDAPDLAVSSAPHPSDRGCWLLECPGGQAGAPVLRAAAELAAESGAEVRVTSDQNLLLLGLEGCVPSGLGDVRPVPVLHAWGPGRTADVVACPGTRTCNLALTSSASAAGEISDALQAAGLEDVPGLRVHASGCSNACSRYWVAGVGLQGMVRRVGGRPVPAYRVLVGGRAGEATATFGSPVGDIPARRAAEAVVRIVRWAADRARGPEGHRLTPADAPRIHELLADLRVIGDPESEGLTRDLGKQDAFVPVRGQGECASR